MRNICFLAVSFLLTGCGATAGISALGSQSGQISGTAAQLFGIPAATVATQVGAEIDQMGILAMKFQMLRAQLNGTPVIPPPLPVPASMVVQ